MKGELLSCLLCNASHQKKKTKHEEIETEMKKRKTEIQKSVKS